MGLRIPTCFVYAASQSGRGKPVAQEYRHGTTSPQEPPRGGRTALFESDQTLRHDAARQIRSSCARAARQCDHAGGHRLHLADLEGDLAHGLVLGPGRLPDRGTGDLLLLFATARGLGAFRRARARRCHHARPRGQGLCLAGRNLWHHRPRPDRAIAAQCRGRDRRQALLRPSRHRPARHCQRHQDQHGRGARPAGGQWRLDHHPAGLETALPWRNLRSDPLEGRSRL